MSNIVANKFKKILKGYSAFERKKFPFVYLLIAFPVIQMVVFWFYVNLSGISLAFQDANGNWSLDSFKAVFAVLGGQNHLGYDVRSMLFKSVFIWFSNHIVINFIGILSTFILTKHMIGHKFFRTCYMIPGLLGTVVFVSIVQEFYAYDGILVSLVKKMEIDVPFSVFREGFLGDGVSYAYGANVYLGTCGRWIDSFGRVYAYTAGNLRIGKFRRLRFLSRSVLYCHSLRLAHAFDYAYVLALFVFRRGF